MYVNGQMKPVETIPGIGEGRIREHDGGGWIQLWYIVRTFCKCRTIRKKRKQEMANVWEEGYTYSTLNIIQYVCIKASHVAHFMC
jgi:hypothetical protein